MAEEQEQNQSPSDSIEDSIEDNKGASKVIIVVIVLIIIAAVVVFSRQNINGDISEPDTPAATEQQGTTSSEQEPSGTVIDDGVGFEVDAAEAEFHEFDVIGKNFEFSLGEIKVKKGDTVRINFSSTDGFHDWVVDEFVASTERVNTGDTSSVIFVADQSGIFEYYCGVGNHRQLGMVGNLIVE